MQHGLAMPAAVSPVYSSACEVGLESTEAAQPHHAGRRVVGGDVVCKVPPGQLPDVLCRPQDGVTQGGVLERRGMQVVEYYLLWYTLHLNAQAFSMSDQTSLATYTACCICYLCGQVKLTADRPGISEIQKSCQCRSLSALHTG